MHSKSIYVVDSTDTIDRPTALVAIEQEGLATRLFATVPAYGGGPFAYAHPCTFQGVLNENETGLHLSQLHKLVLYRDQEEFVVLS